MNIPGSPAEEGLSDEDPPTPCEFPPTLALIRTNNGDIAQEYTSVNTTVKLRLIGFFAKYYKSSLPSDRIKQYLLGNSINRATRSEDKKIEIKWTPIKRPDFGRLGENPQSQNERLGELR